MSNILTDAEDEIGRTAEEAVKAAIAESTGEIAYQKSLAESRNSLLKSLQEEFTKINRSRRRWRNASLIEGFVVAGGILVLGLIR